MDRDKTVIAVLSIFLLSTLLFVTGVAANVLQDGDDMKGEWHLTFIKGYGPDGEFTYEENFDTSLVLYVAEDADGIIEGTFDGIPFVGSVNNHIIRFALDTDSQSSQMIGYNNVSGILNVSVISYNADLTLESYSMLFTRDKVMPHMVDFLSLSMMGEWTLNHIEGSNISGIEINITSQNTTVAKGTISYDGQPSMNFVMVVSMLQNESMNLGMMVDENGNLWTISVKKGLIMLYSAEVLGNEIECVGAYMVRDHGKTFVPVPTKLQDIGIWIGNVGLDKNRETVNVGGFSMEITGQTDCMISGKITVNNDRYEFVGALVTGKIPFVNNVISAELIFSINGTDVRVMMFIDGNFIRMVAFNGQLPENVMSIEFVR